MSEDTKSVHPVEDVSPVVQLIQREQEGFRLALMGDAVSVAASAVYFAVRLVDATFDLHVSSALNGMDRTVGGPEIALLPEQQLAAIKHATDKYQTFLEFKDSEELRSMAISLVLPLLLMRVLGAMKDAIYSCWLSDGNVARRVLDVLDCIVLYLTGAFSLGSIPPLEEQLMRLSKTGAAWENSQMFETFDELEFCHLVALAQGGLLLMVSLLKLSARLERSSARIVERAIEFDALEKVVERETQERTLVASRSAPDSQVIRKEIVLIEQQTEEEVTVISTGASTPVLSGEEQTGRDSPKSKVTVEEEVKHFSMDSDEFYRQRGWKRIAIPATPISPAQSTEAMAAMARMDAYNPGNNEGVSVLDVLMGASVSIATFIAVHHLHDPVVKLFRS